ncbi:MAG: hypothetical protein ACP5I4_10855 [Oceanipulchritudo sp.]
MKLSEFDLAWYAQWKQTHAPLDEWSRPGLTNFLGSLQTTGDPTGIRNIVFPPLSGAEESTGYLTLNGKLLAATRIETEVSWCPWEIRREAVHNDWRIVSRLTMVAGEQAAYQEIRIRNASDRDQHLQADLRLSGRLVNRGVLSWFWGIPKVAITLDALHGYGGLYPEITRIGDNGLLFKESVPREKEIQLGFEYAGRAYNAQVVYPRPNQWLDSGDMRFERTLAPGDSLDLHLIIAMDTTEAARDTALKLLEKRDILFAQSEALWRNAWKGAFDADADTFSGTLPDWEIEEELAPVAVSAILCALQSRRTFRHLEGDTVYNISTPRRVEACFYPNDWALAGDLLARMDPEVTWKQLGMALKANIRKNNQINLLTGEGGDALVRGWPYTIDVFNCFYVAWQLWQLEGGDRAALKRRSLPTPGGPKPLFEVLVDLGLDWRKRKVAELGLADYGPKEELLECVSTYAHVVAGLNAGAVWMLRRLSEVYRLLDDTETAESLSREADQLAAAIVDRLYVRGKGYFQAMNSDGTACEVRHCWDLGMVLFCLGPELPEEMVREMVAFFRAELMTPGWIRALSPLDRDAATSGNRADHQFNGAYGAWPAQVAIGLLRVGEQDLVREWLTGLARTARQGPFGQAHYAEESYAETFGGATKVTDEVPQCCHWSNISGGLFWELIRELAECRKEAE